MKKFSLASIALFSCIAMSSYYDINQKYVVKDASCIPTSSLHINYKKDKIENYINTNKKNLRQKPTYEKID
jgi:hypothetical protein